MQLAIAYYVGMYYVYCCDNNHLFSEVLVELQIIIDIYDCSSTRRSLNTKCH